MQGAGRLRRMAPFALIGIAVGIVYLVRNSSTLDAWDVGLLLGTAALITATMLLVPWERLPDGAQVAVPLAWIVLVFIMQVVALPADIDVAIIMLLPLIWTAAYGTRWQVTLVAGIVVASIIALQLAAALIDKPFGLTGWTEVVGLTGTVLLMSYFTLSARSEARSNSLTNLPNRRAWDAIVPLEMDFARRHASPLSVGLIDLDDFKSFNDSHGHAAGDAHLAACATAWPAVLRTRDVLARVGGEEFAVLLPGADAEGAARVLERLAALTPRGETCSVGVAEWDERPSVARRSGAVRGEGRRTQPRANRPRRAWEARRPPCGGQPFELFFDAFSGLSAFCTCSGSSVEWYTGRPHSSRLEIGARHVVGAALQIDSVR
jgi:diguanylate cyclase (GGDEF)-like protein